VNDNLDKWLGRTWSELLEKYFPDSEEMMPPWMEWADPEDMGGAVGRFRKPDIGFRPHLHICGSLLNDKPMARRVMLHEMIHQVTGVADHAGHEWAAEIKRVAGLLDVSVPENPHTFPLVGELNVG